MLTLLGVVRECSIGNGRRSRWCRMSDVLESRLVLELRRHHLWFNGAMMGHSGSIIIIIVIIIHALPFPREIRWAFMLVGTSILQKY